MNWSRNSIEFNYARNMLEVTREKLWVTLKTEEEEVVNLISAYAPQGGCTMEEKDNRCMCNAWTIK